MVTLKHTSFGDIALDFDLQARCDWKVKEGSDSSSWRKPGGPDQQFQSCLLMASWAFFHQSGPRNMIFVMLEHL